MKTAKQKPMSLAEERRHIAKRMKELEASGRITSIKRRRFCNRRGQPATGAFVNC